MTREEAQERFKWLMNESIDMNIWTRYEFLLEHELEVARLYDYYINMNMNTREFTEKAINAIQVSRTPLYKAMK